MPYALKHSDTGTLLACIQRNGYKLAYYGIMLWEQQLPGPREISEALAEAGIHPSDEAGNVEDWVAIEFSEHETKMANVKLRNDPRRIVFYRDGIIAAADAAHNG